MTIFKDYYKILQIDSSAEIEVVEAAFRKLSKKYHPDANKDPGAEEKYKEITEAYFVLKDPEKRKRYHSEWVNKKGKDFKGTKAVSKPKPVVEPYLIRFDKVEPGEIKTASFVIRNIGGPYSRIWFNNPNSWVRIINYATVDPYQDDELPLRVDIEAEGEDWGKDYSEYIRVKLDEEEIQVRIELQTKQEPVGVGPTYTYTPPPTAAAPSRRFPAWAKWIIGLVILGMVIIILRAMISTREPSTQPDGVPIEEEEAVTSDTFPTGSKIAFVSDRDGNLEIYVMDPSGENEKNLTQNSANDYSPAWSPDGTRIAFVSDRDGKPDIYVMNADGNQTRRLTRTGGAAYPAWFPTGNRIAFGLADVTPSGYDEVGGLVDVIDVDGGNYQHLADHSGFVGGGPAISPDGEKIAYMLGTLRGGTMRLIYANGKTLREFTFFFDGQPFNPSWSPDGKWIAFYDKPNDGVLVVDPNSGNVRRLTEVGRDPSWSGDGKWIIFASGEGGWWERGILKKGPSDLHIINLDSKISRKISVGEGNRWDPSWWSPIEEVAEEAQAKPEEKNSGIQTENEIIDSISNTQPIIDSVTDSLGRVYTNSWAKDTSGAWTKELQEAAPTISIGDTITFTINVKNASDLLYIFEYSNAGHYWTTIQDWSNSNICTWTVPDDAGGTFYGFGPRQTTIIVGVKNKDELNYYDDVGDDCTYLIYVISSK